MGGVDLSVANDMKALGVVIDRRLTFGKHAMAVARSCNYHSQAIRHLLSTELAVTLACSHSATAPTYLSHHINPRVCERTLRLYLPSHYWTSR